MKTYVFQVAVGKGAQRGLYEKDGGKMSPASPWWRWWDLRRSMEGLRR